MSESQLPDQPLRGKRIFVQIPLLMPAVPGIHFGQIDNNYGVSQIPRLAVKNCDFPVVGIGASAGGLAALTAFFDATEPTSGVAYVVIRH